MKTYAFIFALLLSPVAYAQQQLPIIDMHLHAFRMEEVPPGAPTCPGDQRVLIPTIDPKDEFDFSKFVSCDSPMLAADSDADLMHKSIASCVATTYATRSPMARLTTLQPGARRPRLR